MSPPKAAGPSASGEGVNSSCARDGSPKGPRPESRLRDPKGLGACTTARSGGAGRARDTGLRPGYLDAIILEMVI